jgi:hypothetical protein
MNTAERERERERRGEKRREGRGGEERKGEEKGERREDKRVVQTPVLQRERVLGQPRLYSRPYPQKNA